MTFQPVHNPDHLYFVTGTIVGWKRLFLENRFQEIVLGSLQWLRRNHRMQLYAFVLMPHHVHFICKPNGGNTISQVLQTFGSYTSHEFLRTLRAQKRDALLHFFHGYASRNRGKEQHQFWQKIQAKNIFTRVFLHQKLEYIHNNPMVKHWNLATNRWEYELSSACFYDQGAAPIIPVDDVGRVLG